LLVIEEHESYESSDGDEDRDAYRDAEVDDLDSEQHKDHINNVDGTVDQTPGLSDSSRDVKSAIVKSRREFRSSGGRPTVFENTDYLEFDSQSAIGY